jgi:hypothetical protein
VGQAETSVDADGPVVAVEHDQAETGEVQPVVGEVDELGTQSLAHPLPQPRLAHGNQVDLTGVAPPGLVRICDQLGNADDLARGLHDELNDASCRRQPLTGLFPR